MSRITIEELNEMEREIELEMNPHMATKMYRNWKEIFDTSLAKEFNIEMQDLSYKEYTRLINEGYEKNEALEMADKKVFIEALNNAVEKARKEANYIFIEVSEYERQAKQKQVFATNETQAAVEVRSEYDNGENFETYKKVIQEEYSKMGKAISELESIQTALDSVNVVQYIQESAEIIVERTGDIFDLI